MTFLVAKHPSEVAKFSYLVAKLATEKATDDHTPPPTEVKLESLISYFYVKQPSTLI